MDKYEKLFKGLEMCAGPDCNPECPYHGETRGGKTCRASLLHDAAAALAVEVEGHAAEPGLAETMEIAVKSTVTAEYWRGQADALKWCFRFYYGDEVKPEPEATDNV